MRIAVVGTGIAGLAVAHRLHRDHDVVVLEADDRVGGHTHTVEVEVEGRTVPVDMGFIVCNDRTYPELLRLFRELGVATRPTLMSFSVTDASTGSTYGTHGPGALAARPTNLVRPRFARMLVDVLRGNRLLRAVADGDDDDPGESLGAFVDRHRLSSAYVEDFLVPLGSAIWSADPTTFLDLPVATYARFVANHGIIDLRDRPRWHSLPGGSATYVRALVAPFAHRIRTATPVRSVRRHPGHVEVVLDDGTIEVDHVVLATHSDQALALLDAPTSSERSVLGAIRYQRNEATLHTDTRLLPPVARARAAWNAHVGLGDRREATLTYWMNLLQDLPTDVPLLVTLNRDDAVDPSHVLRRWTCHHPVLDEAAIRAQRRRPEVQGHCRTWFAGAYWGSGFHEDGLVSGLDVVRGVRAVAA